MHSIQARRSAWPRCSIIGGYSVPIEAPVGDCNQLGEFRAGCTFPLPFRISVAQVGTTTVALASHQDAYPIGLSFSPTNVTAGHLLADVRYRNGRSIYPDVPPNSDVQRNYPLRFFFHDAVQAGVAPFPRANPLMTETDAYQIDITGDGVATAVLSGWMTMLVPYKMLNGEPLPIEHMDNVHVAQAEG